MPRYQFQLPQASADVKAIAYTKALEGRVNAPQVQMEEEGVAMMAQMMVMAYRSNESTTNNESLFQSCYVEGFTAGYQFAAYAATQGYGELMQRLDEQERLVVQMQFSYLRYEIPMEAPIVGALATLQEIYQRYQTTQL
jgi:hypothetical protein